MHHYWLLSQLHSCGCYFCYHYCYPTHIQLPLSMLSARDDEPKGKLQRERDWGAGCLQRKRGRAQSPGCWRGAHWVWGPGRELSVTGPCPRQLKQPLECSRIFSADLIFVASSCRDRFSHSPYPWHFMMFINSVSIPLLITCLWYQKNVLLDMALFIQTSFFPLFFLIIFKPGLLIFVP